MSSCQNISHVGLSSLTASAGCLRELILAYGSPITLPVADSFQNLSMLQSIRLDGCQVTCAGLKAIGNLRVSLTEVSLRKCMGVTDVGLCSIVEKYKELRKLDISCCRKITNVPVSRIANSCASLTFLRMESCMLVSRKAFVLIGQHCQYLDELDLTDSEIDYEGLKSISKCSNLSSLKLGICLNITDEGLIQVGQLELLTGVFQLGCVALEVINIAYCNNITDQSFFSLSKCSKLNTLESRGCPSVTSLSLAAVAAGCKFSGWRMSTFQRIYVLAAYALDALTDALVFGQ